MANFNGQTAVITGGAQGIGLATAKRFINDGCEVMIWDIDKKLGMDAAKEKCFESGLAFGRYFSG